MGAAIVGVQMGFGLGELFDPLTGAQTESMTQFYGLLVTLVFFAVNGHHMAVLGLVHTFEVIPSGSADLSLLADDRFVPFVGALFGFAFRVALPVVGALVLTDLALGLVARTVPQMNVLVEGFPVKVAVGVLVIAASMPLLTGFMASTFQATLPQLNRFLAAP
jgi:flagellar biosynthetic protein FliR